MRGKRRAPRFVAVRFPNAIEGDVQHQAFPLLMHRAEADGGMLANLPAEERQLLVSNPNYALPSGTRSRSRPRDMWHSGSNVRFDRWPGLRGTRAAWPPARRTRIRVWPCLAEFVSERPETCLDAFDTRWIQLGSEGMLDAYHTRPPQNP